MDDPFDTMCRLENWEALLKQLVLLDRIETFVINSEAIEIVFDIDQFRYYLNFKSEENLRAIYREKVINEMLED